MDALQLALSSSLEFSTSGFEKVEMKRLLISDMNGEEMDSGMKILGYGVQEEISSDFKK